MKINLDEALERLEEARQIDRDDVVANALFRVGVAYLQRSKLDQAAEALDEARHHCGAMENPLGLARVVRVQAELALARGDAAGAVELAREALEGLRAEAETPEVVQGLETLGQTLVRSGDLEPGAAALGEALELVRGGGDKVGELLFLNYLAPVLRGMGRAREALESYRDMGRLAHEMGEKQRVALAAVGMATMHAELGEKDEAAAAFDHAHATLTALGQLQRAQQVRQEQDRLLNEI